jgi:predicted outer membrane repeat protein
LIFFNSNVNLERVSFINNHSGFKGGAICFIVDKLSLLNGNKFALALLKNVQFVGNTAIYGGAIYH